MSRRQSLAFCLLSLISIWILRAVPASAAGGEPDPLFGRRGIVVTDIARAGGTAAGVALQPDGKIVAVGSTMGRNGRFALVRYGPDGSVDTTFGGDGKVTTNFTGALDQGRDVVIQTDGKMVVGGVAGRGRRNSNFALARYNADGTLDESFSEDGTATMDFARGRDGITALAIQSDGRIVAVGTSVSDRVRFAVARYDTSGTLDRSFGENGTVTTSFPGGGKAHGVTLQADGRIVVVGSAGNEAALARYHTDGRPDTSFGKHGRVVTGVFPIYGAPNDVAVQADGRIVTAGEIYDCNPGGRCDSWFALARYESDGTLDPAFPYNYLYVDTLGIASAVSIQADGKIVVAGASIARYAANETRFSIVRYNADGILDDTFGEGGRVYGNPTHGSDGAFAMALQANGKIVAAGGAELDSDHSKFALMRFLDGAA